jgi:hypothetical protein
LLSLSLSSSGCILRGEVLCSGSRSVFVVHAIRVFLKPFLIAVNQSRLEITQVVEDVLPIL